MRFIQNVISLFLFIAIGIADGIVPLTQRYFHTEDMDVDYSRGTYLIVLADESLESILRDDETGNFIHFKQTQGYNVELITIDGIGGTEGSLRAYLQYYIESIDTMLEYVLLIGDINGSYVIPTFTIPSYNVGIDDQDVTDYKYTFFDNEYILSPSFFIGRWSIRSQDDLENIKKRSIQYVKMDVLMNSGGSPAYLNNALVVAGNFSDSEIIPVTPIWTSNWLKDELLHYGIEHVDTAYYYNVNNQQSTSFISTVWDAGVGIINYRGWGDANGWKYPEFFKQDIDPGLHNGWYLPVVMSFVCNTGDFGNDLSGPGLDKCFGETLTTGGSINYPKGAAAMIGPSDLDTDTRFNNVMCAVMWDELLEGRIPELSPALHAGKQALNKEFSGLEVNGTNIAEFYHHVYGVLGDPSLPIWIGEPNELYADIEGSQQLTNKYISTIITGMNEAPLMDVVGALMHGDELIAKGLSNQNGILDMSFEVSPGESLDLYLNKPQYYQKKIELTFVSDAGNVLIPNDYSIPVIETDNIYIAIDSDSNESGAPVYNWIEINENDANLELSDDSLMRNKSLGFDFKYYGKTFDKLTICSNGWASFRPCLGEAENNGSDCNSIPTFFNNSIPHPLGPYGMLAPFFDDLDDNEGIEPLNVYFWTNEQDSVIVEWENIANGQHDEDCVLDDPDSCPRHTFQLILVGSDEGNGEIIFQYNNVTNWQEVNDLSTLWYVDDHGSTVGIESPDKDTGTQYLFNLSDQDALLLHNGLAIKFYDGNGTDLTTDHNIIPQHFTLHSHPNPFNPVVTVSFSVSEIGFANVDIFDIHGRKLTNLANRNYHPGYYSITWDAAAYASGMYFVTLSASDTRITKKILLLK